MRGIHFAELERRRPRQFEGAAAALHPFTWSHWRSITSAQTQELHKRWTAGAFLTRERQYRHARGRGHAPPPWCPHCMEQGQYVKETVAHIVSECEYYVNTGIDLRAALGETPICVWEAGLVPLSVNVKKETWLRFVKWALSSLHKRDIENAAMVGASEQSKSCLVRRRIVGKQRPPLWYMAGAHKVSRPCHRKQRSTRKSATDVLMQKAPVHIVWDKASGVIRCSRCSQTRSSKLARFIEQHRECTGENNSVPWSKK